MREAIDRTASALEQLDRGSPWGPDLKASDEFLTPLFRALPGGARPAEDLMTKKSFYELAEHVPLHELGPGGRGEARRDRGGSGERDARPNA